MNHSRTKILVLDDIGLRYPGGHEALRNVNLVVHAGSFHFLTGPSGSGKTSLLRVISLSTSASKGTLELLGRDIGGLPHQARADIRRRIGVIFQEFRLFHHLSAFDNIALPLRIAGTSEEQISSAVSEMMGWLRLSNIMECKPAQMSMGERQLVSIARAVVMRPAILLADEPLSSVDPERAERLMRLFVHLHKIGTTILMVTHDPELLRQWPYPILTMRRGTLAGPSQRADESLALAVAS